MKPFNLNLAVLGGALLFSASAYASLMTEGVVYQNCNAVTINFIGETPSSTNLLEGAPPVAASSCVRFSGNDSTYGSGGNDNTGEFGDGSLNKPPFPLLDGYENLFADWVAYDSNGDGVNDAFKPGWIGLAKIENGVSYFSVNGVMLNNDPVYGDIIDLMFSSSDGWLTGTWFLQVNESAIQAAKDLLGNSYFDHLNIILKSGNSGFASYNFDFRELFPQVNLERNYSIGGAWSSANLLGPRGQQQQLSHAVFAAHDPLLTTTTTIPAPAPFWLLGLGLGLLLVNRKVRS